MNQDELRESYVQRGLWTEERIGWLLTTGAIRWGDRELLNFDGERYSYRRLWRWMVSVSREILKAGVRPGDRVLVQLGNSLELLTAQLACWRIGVVCVPVIPIYRAREVAHIMRDADPRLVIAAAEARGRKPSAELDEILGELGLSAKKFLVGPADKDSGWAAFPAEPAGHLPIDETGLPEPAAAHECVLILYTSGTTSAPKGVRLSSQALLSNLDSWHRTVELSGKDVFCSGSPLAHIAAMGSALLMPMRIGARTVLMSGWDPDLAIKLIEEERVTYMSGAAVFIHDMVQRYVAGASPGYRLRNFYSGGSATAPELVLRADALGVKVVRCYGMTETAGTVTTAWRDAPIERRAHFDGQVEFGTEMQAVDDRRKPLPPGTIGQIRIRSPKLMLGYTDAEITASQIDEEGWFYPGDVGLVDADGWFRMVGRTKDVINRGGEKFSSVDIEAALSSHPDIEQAAVAGVPDSRLGEVVAAFVTLRKGCVWAGPGAVLAHLDACKLAKAKFPVQWYVLDRLPTGATGKIVKHELLEIARRAFADNDNPAS